MVSVAEVSRPHGVKGEVRVRVWSGDPTLLLGRPPLRLRLADGRERDARIDLVRETEKGLLMTFEGVADRNGAEAIRGAQILVARDRFPPLEEGEFYACDVEGAAAVLSDGTRIGTVVGLGTYPTCDVLVVDKTDGKKVEIPNLPSFVEDIDTERGVVRIVTLEGLE